MGLLELGEEGREGKKEREKGNGKLCCSALGALPVLSEWRLLVQPPYITLLMDLGTN